MATHRIQKDWKARLRGLVPFGLGQTKPKHFRDMMGVAWENRDNLGYAWKVLSRGVVVARRAPGHDRELAAGFLVTEQIIRQRRDLKEITICWSSLEPDKTLNV